MSELAETQRRLWRLLTAPSGVRTALAEAGDPEGASLDGWLCSDATAPAALRLEVYANAYFQRILGVMAADFGALAASLGELAFHDLVTAYLCVNPPERPSLRHVGERLAGFLEVHAAAGPFRRRWPFAADLARLEIALADAFDAPDEKMLSREDLAAVPPDQWQELALSFQPALRLLGLRRAAVTLRQRFDAGDGIGPIEEASREIPVVVWRRREGVLFRELETEEAVLLEAVRQGVRFGELCEVIATRNGTEAAPAQAAGWLATWVDAGLLAR